MKYLAVAMYKLFFEEFIMNTRVILATVATAFLLSGCDLFGFGLVTKSTLDQVIAERDAAKADLKNLKDNPPKPEEILPSTSSCKVFIDTAVANKICQAAPVKKAVAKPKAPYVNKHASGGKALPDPVPTAPVAAARAPGGCTYESDGKLILKGKTEKVKKGEEVARISDGDLRVKYPKLVAAHPYGFVSNNGHLALCNAWSHLAAEEIQSPEGRRVNNDTHRTQ